MAEPQAALIGEINCYPYECRTQADGTRGFEEHHLGLSKLSLYKESQTSFKLVALRQEDGHVLHSFYLGNAFRVRYTHTEHFLMLLDKPSGSMYGYGTCKDHESVEKTKEFSKMIMRKIHDLSMQFSRQESRLDLSSQQTTNRNIDAIQAFLPGTSIAEEPLAAHAATDPVDGPGELYNDGKIVNSVSAVQPRLVASPSVTGGNTQNHIPIMAPKSTAPVIDEALTEKITNANLRRHRNSITIDPDAVPLELRLDKEPQPEPTGTDQDFDNTVAKMGELAVVEERKTIKQNPDVDANPSFSKPTNVVHTAHMSFGKDGFKGVPPEWMAELQRQFGVELVQLPACVVSPYSAKIPFVLQTLRDLLIDKGGLSCVGIFRIAPEAMENDKAKDDINKGLLLSKSAKRDEDGKLIFDYEVHVISNLIKVWLRDLPTPLLHHVDRARVESCNDAQEATDILNALPDPFKSVAQYLVDFLSVVASHHAANKMTPQNLAICFCPNLFKGNPNDQMATLVFTQKISKLFTLAIQYRIDHPCSSTDEDFGNMLYSTESSAMLPSALPSTPR